MLIELMNEGLVLVQSVAATSPLDKPVGVGRSWEAIPENLIPIIAIVLGCTVAIVAILVGMVNNTQREKTRREIAAYVAEGSISPEDAERMMRAASVCSKD